MESQDAQGENDKTSDFQAAYNGDNSCTYTYITQPSLTIDYDSISGEILINK
ncbi:MAG: hypothetical protein ACSHW0_08675 [Thalassotalea sp.]